LLRAFAFLAPDPPEAKLGRRGQAKITRFYGLILPKTVPAGNVMVEELVEMIATAFAPGAASATKDSAPHAVKDAY